MDINLWFKNGCDYKKGVAIYANLNRHKPNLLKLFLKKKSPSNLSKLKYELSKHQQVVFTKPAVLTPSPSLVTQEKTKTPSCFYRLNQLHLDIHPLAIKQRNDYQLAISLHCKMVSLHTDEEGEALNLALQIEDLFDAIETTQKVLDYYIKHKVVLNLAPRTYKDYTGGQLADARRNKRTSVTKYKNKVNAVALMLKKSRDKTEKTKHKIALQKAEKKLIEHQLDLQKLTDLINDR